MGEYRQIYQSKLLTFCVKMQSLYQQPNLPEKFAQNLLDCEIELELNDKLAPSIIVRLLQLYRIGLEYYQSIRCYKYLYFQRKMNQIVKSERIVSNLNYQKEEIIIESLTEFKKQQISINSNQKTSNPQNSPVNTGNKKKISNPFKRQIQQKITAHLKQQQQKQNKQLLTQYTKQQQLKKLLQMQQKQKHQLFSSQISEKTQLLSSNQEIKKILNIFEEKIQVYDQKINLNINQQEEEFKRKLESRRTRVKSNTDKRRMTKSFSEIGTTGHTETHADRKDLQNTQLQTFVEVKNPRRNIPSTKMFSSFIQTSSNDKSDIQTSQKQDEYADFTFEQVTVNSIHINSNANN